MNPQRRGFGLAFKPLKHHGRKGLLWLILHLCGLRLRLFVHFLCLLMGVPLSTVGFACALLHIKAIAVTCTNPGIVLRLSSSVVLNSGVTVSSSLHESSTSCSFSFPVDESLFSAINVCNFAKQ